LGFTLEEMFYVDGNGTLWSLRSPLATGQKADLSKAEMNLLSDWYARRREASKMKELQNLLAQPRNHFFASAKSAPGFMQDTLSSIRWQQDEILVYGSVTPP